MDWPSAEFARFLETLPDAALVADRGGRIVLANTRAHALLGHQVGALPGQALGSFLLPSNRDSIPELIRQLAATEGAARELAFHAAGGNRATVQIRLAPVALAGSEDGHVAILLRDITEEKKERDLLQLSADRLTQALRVSRMGIFDHDHVSDTIYWSPEQRATYGWSPDEPVTLPKFLEQVYPADRERIGEAVRRAHDPSGPGLFDVEHRIIRRDGEIRWLVTRSQTLFGGAETERRPVRTVGAVLDVTEQRRSEEALRLFRQATDLATEAIFWLNRDGKFLYVNESAGLSLGYTREELLRLTLWDIDTVFSRADWERLWQSFEQPRARPIETWHRRKDGSVFPVEVLAQHLPTSDGSLIIGHVRDVSERHRAEKELRRSEAQLSEAQRIAHLGSWELDLVTHTLTWSDEIYRIFEIDKAQFHPSYETFLAAVHPDDRDAVNAAYTQSVATRTPYAITHRLLLPDGRIKFVQERCETQYGADGTPIRSHGTTQDVTERERAAEELWVKDQAIAAAINAIAITDGVGKITYVNPAFVRLWGYASDEEILGKAPTDFAADEATALRIVRHVQTEGSWQGEFVARRKDGSTFDALLSAGAVTDAHGTVTNMMGAFLDVTERNRLEAQLRQAQKMESVGRLAGGVAHDFNNLLTAISAHVELALLDVRPTDPLYELLTDVHRASDSAANLTRQLLAFSRKQVIDPRVQSLNDIVRPLQKMLQRLLREDINLQVMLDPATGRARVDQGQLEQILVNLAINARDAMPQGGKLTLETANVTLDAEYVRDHPHVTAGEYVMLSVSDEGTGMTDEVKAHLFEPFFTTKGLGKGTGLGLAMVYGAVKQNGGSIEVYSEPGHGTTFKIYLPRVETQAEAQPAPTSLHLPTGTESIMVVEDEEKVRAVATRLLRRQGYTVHPYASGAEALRALAEITGPLHLLVTDVVLPGMNGQILAQQVKARRPETRILYTSGYSENVVIHHGVLDKGIEFIPKPYSIQLLARRVREVLDRPAG